MGLSKKMFAASPELMSNKTKLKNVLNVDDQVEI
jgi:hypothetical protein